MPHALLRKRIILPTVTVVALVGGFEGYGAYTRSTPVTYDRGGQAFAALPTATPSPVTRATASAGATSSPTASTQPSAAPSLADLSSAEPVAAGLAGPSAAPVVLKGTTVPRTGTYELAVSGSEKVKFGVVSFCNQDLPTRTKLVVAAAKGEAKGSYDFDIPYVPGHAGQHDERHIYRYTRDAVFLDYEIATVTCQGVRQSSETSYSPAQLRAKLPLSVGSSWSNKGGDAQRTETSTSKVTGRQTLVVAGSPTPTYVISTTTTISGQESGDRTQTWWYAPSWALPVKWTETIHGQRSGASYSESVTVTVLSRP
ncbi:MAG: hypothetical protein JWO12_3283 [Frankiales bacterium]|nr:hypothetical protein [Frankiales bacterium]